MDYCLKSVLSNNKSDGSSQDSCRPFHLKDQDLLTFIYFDPSIVKIRQNLNKIRPTVSTQVVGEVT